MASLAAHEATKSIASSLPPPMNGRLVHTGLPTSIKFADTHLNTSVLPKNTIPTRLETWNARNEIQLANR